MSFKPVHPFVHEYDFPITEELAKYQDEIVSHYIESLEINKRNNVSSYNLLYKNESLLQYIEPRVDKLIRDNYIVSERIRPFKLGVYVQNNEHSHNLWHSHIFTSTINGVIYFNLPKSGGGFEFIYQGDEYKLTPRENKIYLFPYWLDHRPLPQKDSDYRICLNIEYLCQTRPIHKHKVGWFDPNEKINIVW